MELKVYLKEGVKKPTENEVNNIINDMNEDRKKNEMEMHLLNVSEKVAIIEYSQ